MMKTYRLKAHLLNNQDNRWFYRNEPFTGIVFFDKKDFLLDVFEVEDGYITKPYISPCQTTLTDVLYSPIAIDATTFSNVEEDIYGCGTIPQLYQDRPYQGMSYTFSKNGNCNYESYTDKEGITQNKMEWSFDCQNPMTYFLDSCQIENYDNFPRYFFSYKRQVNNISFYLEYWDINKIFKMITIEYNLTTKKVKSFELVNNILYSQEYLNFAIKLPEVFEMLTNYRNFIFGSKRGNGHNSSLRLDIDKENLQLLFDIWINNNAFKDVDVLRIKNIEALNDLSLFDNKQYFENLTELIIDKKTSEHIIDELESKNQNLKITLR